jgi:putative transposase
VLGRCHLERILRTYADHYNHERPHRGLALAVPDRPLIERVPVSPHDVRRRAVLGGLINEYHGAAA